MYGLLGPGVWDRASEEASKKIKHWLFMHSPLSNDKVLDQLKENKI